VTEPTCGLLLISPCVGFFDLSAVFRSIPNRQRFACPVHALSSPVALFGEDKGSSESPRYMHTELMRSRAELRLLGVGGAKLPTLARVASNTSVRLWLVKN